MTDPDPRLEKIKAELKAKKDENSAKDKIHSDKESDTESMSVGLRAGAELITSIAAGGFIGYWLDLWLETKPLFLIAMLILGVITGFVNVWRTTQNIGYQVGFKDIKPNREKHEKDG
jgi:ATP synthase protein I